MRFSSAFARERRGREGDQCDDDDRSDHDHHDQCCAHVGPPLGEDSAPLLVGKTARRENAPSGRAQTAFRRPSCHRDARPDRGRSGMIRRVQPARIEALRRIAGDGVQHGSVLPSARASPRHGSSAPARRRACAPSGARATSRSHAAVRLVRREREDTCTVPTTVSPSNAASSNRRRPTSLAKPSNGAGVRENGSCVADGRTTGDTQSSTAASPSELGAARLLERRPDLARLRHAAQVAPRQYARWSNAG